MEERGHGPAPARIWKRLSAQRINPNEKETLMRYRVTFETDGDLAAIVEAIKTFGEGRVFDISITDAASAKPVPHKKRTIKKGQPARDAVVAFIAGLLPETEFSTDEVGKVLSNIGFAATSASPILSGLAKEKVVKYVKQKTYAKLGAKR